MLIDVLTIIYTSLSEFQNQNIFPYTSFLENIFLVKQQCTNIYMYIYTNIQTVKVLIVNCLLFLKTIKDWNKFEIRLGYILLG